MSQVLEFAQLVQRHDVAEVNVRSRRVRTQLDAQRAVLGQRALELAPQFVHGMQVHRAVRQNADLPFDFFVFHDAHIL